MKAEWLSALQGGLLIGFAVSVMLFLNGRVTGISGIINGALSPIKGEILWRIFFIFGLFSGGIILNQMHPEFFENTIHQHGVWTFVAGLLVGFGTLMGSGCTSGHGVCGISRLSVRSIAATIIFIFAGMLSVFIFKKMGVFQ